MKTAIMLTGLALVLALGTAAAASNLQPRCHDACTPTVGDPDPADCPFCGGNPQLHIQRMFELEHVQTALFTGLLH